ncbi:MAG TPA: NUDIX domain-containing protein [Candidatus Kapabacteria bacterium]|jgi:mutator protein MutT
MEASAAVILKNAKLLLVKRSSSRAFYPGIWDLPGGHHEKGETGIQCLQRELFEELGIKSYSEKFLMTCEIGGLTINVFIVEEWDGEPANLQRSEHEELKWVTVSEARERTALLPEYSSVWSEIQKMYPSFV